MKIFSIPFYAPNEGDPLTIAKTALLTIHDRYERLVPNWISLPQVQQATANCCFQSFSTECHVVETDCPRPGCRQVYQRCHIILDIGGQDMKAIWIDNGIITNIVVNEACSSGCGSFLGKLCFIFTYSCGRNCRSRLFHPNIRLLLAAAVRVFMNSSIVTEQRNGKQSADIMAGLCRSIIENVFTKVIRISNLDSLGDKIVVQGGTFRNDAVLRALEQYTGREVIRAPYPGIMGAIGAALITKKRFEQNHPAKTFIGIDGVADFSYTQEANAPCPFCANHCKRTIVRFFQRQFLGNQQPVRTRRNPR